MRKVAALWVFFCLFLFSQKDIEAAGFALIEQGVSGLGNAYAGGAASALDATTIYFNPAGMKRIKSTQAVVAGYLIVPNAEFHNEGSIKNKIGNIEIPLTGNNGGNAGVVSPVGNLYFVIPANKVFFGLGIYSPFGLQTEYSKDWVGRYHAIKSSVKTVNINPSLAIQATENLSFGAGLNFMYMSAELSNAIDLSKYSAPDGFVKLKGDSWAAGFNAGVLYEFNNSTRVGFSYRSKVRQNLEGNAYFSDIPPPLQGSPKLQNDKIKSTITLPASASLSFYHEINDKWSLMADITWTEWKTLNEIRIKFANNREDSVTTTSWKNSMRYSIGTSYKATDKLVLRTGIAYDETPIPDAQHRTPRIPDTDRIWIAFGAGYKFSEKINLDVGYAHLFFKKSHINKNFELEEDKARGGLKGYYKGYVDIVGVQFTYNF